MALFLEPFKAVAAEGAVVELKLRLLAGKRGLGRNVGPLQLMLAVGKIWKQ
jgi:hypothetical protein